MQKERPMPLAARIETVGERLFEGKLPTVVLSLSYPVFEGALSAERNKETKGLISLIKKAGAALSLRVLEGYEKAENANKRFTHRPLCITFSVEKEEQGGRLFLFYSLSVTHRGRGLESYTFRESFSIKNGRPCHLPPHSLKAKKILDFFRKRRYNRRDKIKGKG